MPSIGFELFQWFVDEVGELKCRADARLCMDKAQSYVDHLIDAGYDKTSMPTINKWWFKRWRTEFGISYRAVTTRFKVSMGKACARVACMLGNIFRLQFLWELCHPGVPMRWFSMDQKPSWFNNAGLKKTLARKGHRRVTVAENFHATRSRYTICTIVQSWRRARGEPPKVAVLFKGKRGSKLADGISAPHWMLIQFQEKGSYRSEDVVDFLEWALPEARTSEESVVVLLDWFSAHLSDAVRNAIQSKGMTPHIEACYRMPPAPVCTTCNNNVE